MLVDPRSIRGCGAAGNPPNRFKRFQLQRDANLNPEEDPLQLVNRKCKSSCDKVILLVRV